jgi:hypothetical protein
MTLGFYRPFGSGRAMVRPFPSFLAHCRCSASTLRTPLHSTCTTIFVDGYTPPRLNIISRRPLGSLSTDFWVCRHNPGLELGCLRVFVFAGHRLICPIQYSIWNVGIGRGHRDACALVPSSNLLTRFTPLLQSIEPRRFFEVASSRAASSWRNYRR